MRLTKADPAEAFSWFRTHTQAGLECFARYKADPTSTEGRLQLAQAWRHVEAATALLSPEALALVLAKDAPQ